MVSMPNPREDEMEESKKKLMSEFNEEDLIGFFKGNFHEAWEKKGWGKLSKEALDTMCREAWRNLPLPTLAALIAAYKIKLVKDASLARTETNIATFFEKRNKCNSTNRDGKSTFNKKEEVEAPKANGRDLKCEKNKGDGKGKAKEKPSGSRTDCGKGNEKKDSTKCGKKSKESKGKGKENDGKCGEKKGRENCANSKDKSRSGEKKDCGKGPEKNDGGKNSPRKGKGKINKKQGKDDDNGHRVVKRKRSESAKKVNKKQKLNAKPQSPSSSDVSESDSASRESESDESESESAESEPESAGSESGSTDESTDRE